MKTSTGKTSFKSIATTLLLVFSCFTLTSSGYLSWLYHLMTFVPPATVDALSMGVGYLFQAVGIGIAAFLLRYRPDAMSRAAFVVAIALNFACAAPASLSDSLAGTLVFGYVMNLLCGVISAFYLLRIVRCIGEERRGIVFGGGYACSIIVTYLLSLVPVPAVSGMPGELVSCAVLSLIAVGIVVATREEPLPAADALPQGEASTREGGPSPAVAPSSGASGASGLIALAAITVLLMSMVKNVGFSFPTADLTTTGSLELSRLFYAAGLIIAGIVVDRSRKYGSILCMSALVTPFALMALSGEPISGMVLWAVDYLFYGFFSVFRIVLFADIAARANRAYLSGLGLLLGRVGDALGTFVCLSLAGSTVMLVVVAVLLFVACVFTFYLLFQQLFMPAPAAQRSEREIFDAFAVRYALSPREREVARFALDGKTNAEIAATLFVTESTVKYHMRNALKKTGCKNRAELLTLYATEDR